VENVKRKFIDEITDKPLDLMASVWIIDRIPIIFNQNIEKYASWRCQLAKGMDVDPSSLIITGSSSIGVSLNPYKNYKLFDSDSDIDVAVISEYHFNVAWRTLRNLGTRIHALPPIAKQSIHDHVQKYIYWGTIATDKILHIFPFGKSWNKALDEMRKVDPTEDRIINARIYKDLDSLRAYQISNLKSIRTKELGKGIVNVEIS
jgi:hypothetical protein